MPPACSPLGARLDVEGEICDLSDNSGRPRATSCPGTQTLAERPLGRLDILIDARNSAQQKAVSSDHGPQLWLFYSPRDRWALLETFPGGRTHGSCQTSCHAQAHRPAGPHSEELPSPACQRCRETRGQTSASGTYLCTVLTEQVWGVA